MPEGHSIRTLSTERASPKPKIAAESFWLRPAPPEISRNSQIRRPEMVASTRILAPTADEFEIVPTSLDLNQPFPLPLLWYKEFLLGRLPFCAVTIRSGNPSL